MTGKRNYSKKTPEPEEIIDIEIRKVAQRITREDLLTDDEEQEILDACGNNLRNRAMISLQMEAGDMYDHWYHRKCVWHVAHLVISDRFV